MSESGTKKNGAAQIRAIVADEDPLARSAIREILEADGILVVAEPGDTYQLLDLTIHCKPDVLLLDRAMSRLDALDTLAALAERAPETRVLVLANSEDDEMAVRYVRAGAQGFLAKTVSRASFPRAVRAAVAGEPVLSRRVVRLLVDSLRSSPVDGAGIRPVRSPLTSREWEVLDLLARGLPTHNIASALFVSDETVRSHIKHIRHKLGVRSRSEAVEAARRLRTDLSGTAPTDA